MSARTSGELSVLCEALDGFMLDNGFAKNAKSPRVIASTSQVVKYQYTAPIGPMVPTELVVTTMGRQVIAHCSVMLPVKRQSNLVTVMVSCGEYCRETNTSSGINFVMHRKRDFRNRFVTEVIHKLLTNLRRDLELPERGTLMSLSHEVKLIIMSCLDPESVLSLSEVNKELYMLSQDPQLWRGLYVKSFCQGKNSTYTQPSNDTEKENFICKYKIQKDMNSRLVPCLLPSEIYPSLPLPTFPTPPSLVPLFRDNNQLNDILQYRHIPNLVGWHPDDNMR